MTTPRNTAHGQDGAVLADGSHTTPATSYQDRRWKTWPDWLNLLLGAYLALSPLWTLDAPAGWFVTLGALIVAVSLWALASASSAASEWVQIVLGAVTFVSPWIAGFAAITGAAWTAWIIGVLVIVFAAIGMAQGKANPRPTAYAR